ncbi:MAG TPA: glycogen debranching N-terminal domain-containing protein [Dehalococcoidia bacterium]|nr:glycogen debranching N-terminal domain-containing protein [Dehalococcoidia bacterium]
MPPDRRPGRKTAPGGTSHPDKPAGDTPTTDAEPMSIEDIRDALVIRHNGTFLLMDTNGDVPLSNASGLGLYRDDTRYLSRYEFSFSEMTPVRLLTTAALGFGAEQVYTNPSMRTADDHELPRGVVEVRRQRAIGEALEERLLVTSFHVHPIALEFRYTFDADFADIFEVRGLLRSERGTLEAPEHGRRSIAFAYTGRDGVRMRTFVEFSREPEFLSDRSAVFRLALNPRRASELSLTISPTASALRRTARAARKDDDLLSTLGQKYEDWRRHGTRVFTSNELFNTVLSQSLSDLRTLWNDGEAGGYLAAGTPWFDALFGRDSAIASLQTLSFNPSIARQTLLVLAAKQGREVNAWRDEEPGKVLHEIRRGETARTGEVPFGLYYGSIDSTPLFLLLAAEYWLWTADTGLLRELLPAIRAGLNWARDYGDRDGDTFLEYERQSERGLLNQGWKDSGEAIVDGDGEIAKQPIALVEVQGYLYAAKRGLATVMGALRENDLGVQLGLEATALRKRINREFWMEEGFYALALDGDKRQVTSRSSNPGHLLYTGVPTPARASRVVDGLLRNDLFSGWGIRTLSSDSPRFNPFGYHLGSVWPHDNSIAAMGFKKYGRESELTELATALFDAARSFDYYRLPELFCGTPRTAHHAPVPYPVACRPQAWAAGAISLLLQAILGLRPSAAANELSVVRPQLPYWLEEVQIRNLRVGAGSVDLLYEQRNRRTQVVVLNATAGIRVTVAPRWPL